MNIDASVPIFLYSDCKPVTDVRLCWFYKTYKYKAQNQYLHAGYTLLNLTVAGNVLITMSFASLFLLLFLMGWFEVLCSLWGLHICMESIFNCSSHFMLIMTSLLEVCYPNLRIVFGWALVTGVRVTFIPVPGRCLCILLREWLMVCYLTNL